jgi:hypothetical protein
MATSAQNSLIAERAYVVVTKIAPEELPLFPAISTAYFQNPHAVSTNSEDEMLGFGMAEVVSLMTPTVLVVMNEVIMLLTTGVTKSLEDEGANFISEGAKKLLNKFRPRAKKEQHDLLPLTPEQLVQVRQQVYEKAHQLKLPDDKARLLADAIAGSLVQTGS